MADWFQELSPEDRQVWDDFVRHTRESTVQQMANSAFVTTLSPGEEDVDIKLAVETGLAILLDKPILVVEWPGRPCPPGLRRVAHEVISADLDTEEGKRKIALAVKRFSDRF